MRPTRSGGTDGLLRSYRSGSVCGLRRRDPAAQHFMAEDAGYNSHGMGKVCINLPYGRATIEGFIKDLWIRVSRCARHTSYRFGSCSRGYGMVAGFLLSL